LFFLSLSLHTIYFAVLVIWSYIFKKTQIETLIKDNLTIEKKVISKVYILCLDFLDVFKKLKTLIVFAHDQS